MRLPIGKRQIPVRNAEHVGKLENSPENHMRRSSGIHKRNINTKTTISEPS